MANVLHQVGNLQAALEVFGQAKALHPNATDPIQTARICTAMGHVYYQAKQWVDARDAFQDALEHYSTTTTASQNNASKKTMQVVVMCQQESLDLKRDIDELDERLARQPQ
jgi:tetratricopeptide (TPR) repeat protein